MQQLPYVALTLAQSVSTLKLSFNWPWLSSLMYKPSSKEVGLLLSCLVPPLRYDLLVLLDDSDLMVLFLDIIASLVPLLIALTLWHSD